jgi:hypothetical protein
MMVSLRRYENHSLRIWIRQALRPDIVGRGLSFALIVGSILTAIYQGDILTSGETMIGVLIKIMLNYCVPYIVSTYADIEMLARQQRE